MIKNILISIVFVSGLLLTSFALAKLNCSFDGQRVGFNQVDGYDVFGSVPFGEDSLRFWKTFDGDAGETLNIDVELCSASQCVPVATGSIVPPRVSLGGTIAFIDETYARKELSCVYSKPGRAE